MEEGKTFKGRIENFFYYYKWHTVFTLLAIFMIVTTIIQVRSRIDYDTTITFMGSFGQEEGTMMQFQDHMEQVLSDANEDGEVHVLPYFLSIGGGAMTAQQDSTAAARLQGMILTRETSVMILDKGTVTVLAEGGALEDLTPFYEEYGLELTDTAYGIPISEDNSVFSMFSMADGEYYITRLAKGEEMDRRESADYENAEKVLRMVIEGQIK